MMLYGLRVLNTRPKLQSHTLKQAIESSGGICIDLPALSIVPTSTDWLFEMPNLKQINQTIFTSANAVHFYFSALREAELGSTLSSLRPAACPRDLNLVWPCSNKVIAVGQATAKALHDHGIHEVIVPHLSDSEHLLKLDSLQEVDKQHILLVKGEDGRTLIHDTLSNRGAHITPISVYRRAMPLFNQELIDSIWQDDKVDIILCTSLQAMQHLIVFFSPNGLSWLLHKTWLLISQRLDDAAANLGIKNRVICQYDEILSTIQGLQNAKQRR